MIPWINLSEYWNDCTIRLFFFDANEVMDCDLFLQILKEGDCSVESFCDNRALPGKMSHV